MYTFISRGEYDAFPGLPGVQELKQIRLPVFLDDRYQCQRDLPV